MAVNAKGVFLGTKAAIPAMQRAAGGSIVNIASGAANVGRAGLGAYSATKGAVRLLTKVTAIEHAADNIRCNSVHPGSVDTPMSSSTQADTPEAQAARAQGRPLGRIAQPEEIAYAVLYMASDESSFVTGSELAVDGGSTAV